MFFRKRRQNVDSLIAKSRFSAYDSPVEVSPLHAEELSDVASAYEFWQTFAEGGVGTLATARDNVLRRVVAIKSLKNEFMSDHGVVESFMAEAKLTAQLDHPGVVPVHSLNSGAGTLHIAMKLVNGRTLREYLREIGIRYEREGVQNFDECRALGTRLEYFLKVCDAVSYAHSKGVIHRDIKPENIMIGEFNEVYLMDWGIASTGASSSDADSCLKGTPGFMAPETFATGRHDARTDVFALGMTLFELATLKPGITGGDMNTVIRKTMNGAFEPITHRFQSLAIPEDLRAIIRKAASFDPARRYESVKALAEDVRRFMMGEEVRARPDNALRRAVRVLSRHKAATALAVMAVLLAMAAVTIQSLVEQNAAQARAQARETRVLRFQNAVTAEAHGIDRQFARLDGILEHYAACVSDALSGALASPDTPRAYLCADLRSPATAPPDALFSKLYNDTVSLDYPTFGLAPGLSRAQAEEDIRRLSSLNSLLFRMLSSSAVLPANRASDTSPEGIPALRHAAATEGFPLRHIYVGLPSGLICFYPGKSELAADYDPRRRPWYKSAEAAPGRLGWSRPYYDAWGQGLVITAYLAFGRQGRGVEGVAGLDMTLEYIVRNVLSASPHGPSAKTYILDRAGRVILDSDLARMEDKAKSASAGELDLRPFHSASVRLAVARGDVHGQVEYEHGGAAVLAGFAAIPTIGWTLVKEVPLAELLGAP